jgi:hypothetical protein
VGNSAGLQAVAVKNSVTMDNGIETSLNQHALPAAGFIFL